MRPGATRELLESVETVTLHVDGRPGNSGLFGEAEFGRMQPRSLFLNLSRGFVVDHEALRRSIETGHIAGAVFGPTTMGELTAMLAKVTGQAA